MLESLRQIGALYKDTPSILSEPIRRKFRKEPATLQIIFDFDTNKIVYEMRKFQQKHVEEYRWIGHTFSATKERVARITFTNPKYFPETILNLVEKLSGISEVKELVDLLEQIKEKFIIKSDSLNDELTSKVKESKENEVVLYTICVRRDGNLTELAKEPTYLKAIRYLISPVESIMKGTCHICGKQSEVFTDPAFESGTILKMYVVDQPGYLSGITTKTNKNSLLRTYSICPDCRYDVIIGEKKVSRDFTVNLGDLRAIVIPKIGLLENSAKEDLDRIFNVFKNISGGLGDFDKINENMRLTTRDDWYSFSIVFGERDRAKFDYLGTIQEVPVTRIAMMKDNVVQVAKMALNIWPTDNQEFWQLTLNQISGMIPLRVLSDKVKFSPLIELLTALLKDYQYSYRKLIEFAISSSRAHRFKSYQGLKLFRTNNPDLSLITAVLKFNYLMVLMQKMEMMPQNEAQAPKANLNDDIEKWITQMHYEEWKIALFLMGYLIGRIGNEQFKKDDVRKSVLDKIDFKGMKWDRILRLVGDIMNSLRNYRILKYNESTYYEMTKLIDKSRSVLERNDPNENLFYILTGYSFATYGAIHGGESA